MLSRILIPLIVFMLTLTIPANGQSDYSISSMNGDGGGLMLRDKLPTTFYTTHDGFCWIGTGSTLECLTDRESVVYTFDAPLPNKKPAPFRVNAITELYDAQGGGGEYDIWVGTRQGLWRADHTSRMLKRQYADVIQIPVNSLAHIGGRRLLIGTNNGLYVRTANGLRNVLVDDRVPQSTANHVNAIVATKGGAWLANDTEVVYYDDTSTETKRYPHSMGEVGVISCMEHSGERLFASTDKGYVLTFDVKKHIWSIFAYPTTKAIKALHIRQTATPSSSDQLIVGTDGDGLMLLSTHEGQVIRTLTGTNGSGEGLLSDCITAIGTTPWGDILCGTPFYVGINLIQMHKHLATRWNEGDGGSAEVAVRAWLQTPQYVFIGSREGFAYTDRLTGRTTRINTNTEAGHKLTSNVIFSFHDMGGTVLIGTCGGGLMEFDPRRGIFVDTPLTDQWRQKNDVFQFETASDGTVWMATSDGLYAYNPQTGLLADYNSANASLPGNLVYGIRIDSHDRFWLATDKGVVLFDRKTGKATTKGLPDDELLREPMRTIYEGRDGQLVLTLLDNRVATIDSSLRHVNLIDGIQAFSLTQTSEGDYWLATEMGPLRMTSDMKRYHLFSGTNSSLNATAGAPITAQADGNVWLCATTGLYRLDTRNAQEAPRVKITDMLVNGNRLATVYTMRRDTIVRLKSDQNGVVFTFSTPTPAQFGNTKYEYRLDGGNDSTWHVVGNDCHVAYYNLEAGTYTFRVRQMLCSDTEDAISFSIGRSKAWTNYLIVVLLTIVIVLTVCYLWMRRQHSTIASTAASAPTTSLSDEPSEITPSSSTNEPTTSTSIAATESATPPFAPSELKQKPASGALKMSTAEADQIVDRLRQYMVDKKAYLNHDLKQAEAAVAIGVPTYALSAIFTHHLDTNWYDFLNQYRVDAFRQAVAEKQYERYTIQALSERCGFKSKASFFRAFKHFTGMTPSEYIESHK